MAILLSHLTLALVEPPLLHRTGACNAAASPAEPTLGRRALLTTAGAAVFSTTPLAALAESTLVTRQQAYTRYVPRIERARDYWATKLRKDVATQNWAAIVKELEPVGKKDKGGAIKKAFGPMGLWSSSFSSKVISDKTLAMNAALDEFAEAVATLEIAANGQEKDSGIFSFLGGSKKIDEGSRIKLSVAAYKKGTIAFNKFIEIGNDNLGLNFAPIDTID